MIDPTNRTVNIINRDTEREDRLAHSDKTADSEKISRQIEEFLKNGGQVNHIEPGVSKEIYISQRQANEQSYKRSGRN